MRKQIKLHVVISRSPSDCGTEGSSDYGIGIPPAIYVRQIWQKKRPVRLGDPNHFCAQTAAAGRASHVENFRAFAHAWQGASNEYPGLDGRIAEKQNQRSVLARVQEGGNVFAPTSQQDRLQPAFSFGPRFLRRLRECASEQWSSRSSHMARMSAGSGLQSGRVGERFQWP